MTLSPSTLLGSSGSVLSLSWILLEPRNNMVMGFIAPKTVRTMMMMTMAVVRLFGTHGIDSWAVSPFTLLDSKIFGVISILIAKTGGQ